ncbi:MAG: hypothetical protein PCFJNLEI_01775 [Verrucomicrobiae bacterium]|nr:hypothetical protein [Verrucomicrobiae bacterium]
MIKNREELISALQDVSLLPNSPLKQKDGRWRVAERVETWKAIGPKIFDEHLDRLKKVAVDVLRERDPQFELKPEQRYAASMHGKVLEHSQTLRKGLAETLALMGSLPQVLTSCTHTKPENTAALAVREILQDADWVLWASLNPQLPLLAEAAPDEFLHQVQKALIKHPSPFLEVFSQERNGIAGRNYLTGLLWALETLAWNPSLLTQAIVILGDLAAIDPGGNWANRPFNSIVDVLLPWHPQTCADISKRKAAVVALLRDHPKIGWKLLLSLLPKGHETTSGTQKPSFRSFIPTEWSEKVTNLEYWDQVKGYAELIAKLVLEDRSKLTEVVEHFPNLPEPSRSKILEHLRSKKIADLPESERLPVWEALMDLAAKHRNFAESDWALPKEYVIQLEEIAATLSPADRTLLYRRLFSSRDFELYEKLGDYAEQERQLDERRRQAIGEILEQGALNGILRFVRQVQSPEKVGSALAFVDFDEVGEGLIPNYLETKDQSLGPFMRSFVWTRFYVKKSPWLDSLPVQNWSHEQKLHLLLFLPFVPEVWDRARQLIEDVSLYWRNANVRPYGLKEHAKTAVECLLDNGRPLAAISCLYVMINEGIPFSANLAIAALKQATSTKPKEDKFDTHQVLDVIKWLQANPDVEEVLLAAVEWSYLSLLREHSGVTPKTLERHLTRDPKFFCEVIGYAFRSEKERNTDRQATEKERNIAQGAYRLLHEWKSIPGTKPDGSFDEKLFDQWLQEVRRITSKSGHLGIALDQIGKVLAHAPPSPDGLWIHSAVAEVLNARDAEEMRAGFSCERVNMRGVHWDTQGKQEREIADDYNRKADALDEKGFARIAAAVRGIAKSFEREAELDIRRTIEE